MKHECKEVRELLKKLQEQNFRVVQVTSILYKVYAPDGINQRMTHMSERAFHPLRRWAKKLCDKI